MTNLDFDSTFSQRCQKYQWSFWWSSFWLSWSSSKKLNFGLFQRSLLNSGRILFKKNPVLAVESCRICHYARTQNFYEKLRATKFLHSQDICKKVRYNHIHHLSIITFSLHHQQFQTINFQFATCEWLITRGWCCGTSARKRHGGDDHHGSGVLDGNLCDDCDFSGGRVNMGCVLLTPEKRWKFHKKTAIRLENLKSLIRHSFKGTMGT